MFMFRENVIILVFVKSRNPRQIKCLGYSQAVFGAIFGDWDLKNRLPAKQDVKSITYRKIKNKYFSLFSVNTLNASK